ncbi:MAG: BrnA antitoxin family protein [Gemmatimonadetes bacterium]|nr:BrnA antitoxin family protein [Gemmatimonadota bacterium]
MKDQYDFRGAKRGALDPLPAGKTRITIRLDEDVLEWFKDQVDQAGGGNYQTMINDALREHIDRQTLEELLRKVLREELSRVG